jgi:hypothetical protein
MDMKQIWKIVDFTRMTGVVVDIGHKDFGSRSFFVLKIRTGKDRVERVAISDLAVHLLEGRLCSLVGKKVEIENPPNARFSIKEID